MKGIVIMLKQSIAATHSQLEKDLRVSPRTTHAMNTNQANDIQIWNNHLVKLSKERSRDSFKALFEHFSPLLANYFMAKFPSSNTHQMIEELIQEVMIKIWQKASSYNPEKAAASTWIFTLARNTRIDMLRRQNKHNKTSSIEAEDIWEPSTDEGPYTFLTKKRNELDIKASLDLLPIEQQTVIRKVYMEGKSHTEVAQELELPLGTVKSRVRLAQQKLHHLLVNDSQ